MGASNRYHISGCRIGLREPTRVKGGTFQPPLVKIHHRSRGLRCRPGAKPTPGQGLWPVSGCFPFPEAGGNRPEEPGALPEAHLGRILHFGAGGSRGRWE
ncbi:MAG: hypothetical protein Kow0092_05530 [Deferrisomatales bacterium]